MHGYFYPGCPYLQEVEVLIQLDSENVKPNIMPGSPLNSWVKFLAQEN